MNELELSGAPGGTEGGAGSHVHGSPTRQRGASTTKPDLEVGFARSILAYELPDGQLQLIDGHLRRDLDPEQEVDVEVPDATDGEARALLLSINPLAALAQTQEQLRQRLLEMTPTVSPGLEAAREMTAQKALEPPAAKFKPEDFGAQFHVLVICRDEKEQVELPKRFTGEGLKSKALLA
jgi:hypothetical protein